eukprot:1161667-Pelagomonas_calceolata.AAC.11
MLPGDIIMQKDLRDLPVHTMLTRICVPARRLQPLPVYIMLRIDAHALELLKCLSQLFNREACIEAGIDKRGVPTAQEYAGHVVPCSHAKAL